MSLRSLWALVRLFSQEEPATSLDPRGKGISRARATQRRRLKSEGRLAKACSPTPAMSAAFRNVARGPRRPTPQERMMLCRRALLVLCRRGIMLAFFRAGGPTTSHKSGVVMHSLMLPCRSGPYRGRLVPEKKVWAVSVSLNFQTHE